MAVWTNNDGLRVKLGTTEAEVTRGGWLNTNGDQVCEFVIDLANLGSASAKLEDTDDVIFPSGFMTTQVEVINETAATGSNATLNLGLLRQDYSTADDADGFLAAAPRTDWDAVGETLVYRVGTTGAGAYLGVPLTNAGVLCADYDTAAFTAGRIRVRIYGYVKRPSPSNA